MNINKKIKDLERQADLIKRISDFEGMGFTTKFRSKYQIVISIFISMEFSMAALLENA